MKKKDKNEDSLFSIQAGMKRSVGFLPEYIRGWPSGPVFQGMLASLAGCARVPHGCCGKNLAVSNTTRVTRDFFGEK